MHTGLDKAKPQALTVFAHTWNRADRWARVIVPPNKLPATAEALPYLTAAADLEQTGRLRAAETAYRTALDQWPEEPAARFGLGNTLWMQGKREQAVGEFRAVTNAHPDFSPAWHNLAFGLEKLGHAEAANAIRICVAEHQPPNGCTRLIPPR